MASTVTCSACSERYTPSRKAPDCPICLTPPGAKQPAPVAHGGPAVLVRTYPGFSSRVRSIGFNHEAQRLAQAGWRVATQSQGGLRLTVTYVRATE